MRLRSLNGNKGTNTKNISDQYTTERRPEINAPRSEQLCIQYESINQERAVTRAINTF